MVTPSPTIPTPARILASRINGREYRSELTEADIAYAREHRLLVCYGASDDLGEVRGMITEEVDAYNGGVAIINRNGLRLTWDQLTSQDAVTQDEYREWFRDEHLPIIEIRFEWDLPDQPAWLVSASCPSTELFDGDTLFDALCCEPFDVMEDGEVFCRGLVIDMSLLSAGGALGV